MRFDRRIDTGNAYSAGFFGSLANAFSLLNRDERARAFLLVFSMIINGVLGLVGIASILPLFQLMIDPSPLTSDQFLGRLLRAMKIKAELDAVILVGSGVVFAIIVKNVYILWHTRLVNRYCAKAESRLATEVLQRIVHSPLSWLLKQNSSILRDVVVIN